MEDFADFFLAEPAGVERTIEGFTLTPYPLPQQEGQLDLALEMGGEQDGAYCGAFKFNTDLFTPATVAEISTSFGVLVETLVERPDLPLGDLPLTTPAQEATLLFRGRGRDLDTPRRRPVRPDRHAGRAHARPGAPCPTAPPIGAMQT